MCRLQAQPAARHACSPCSGPPWSCTPAHGTRPGSDLLPGHSRAACPAGKRYRPEAAHDWNVCEQEEERRRRSTGSGGSEASRLHRVAATHHYSPAVVGDHRHRGYRQGRGAQVHLCGSEAAGSSGGGGRCGGSTVWRSGGSERFDQRFAAALSTGSAFSRAGEAAPAPLHSLSTYWAKPVSPPDIGLLQGCCDARRAAGSGLRRSELAGPSLGAVRGLEDVVQKQRNAICTAKQPAPSSQHCRLRQQRGRHAVLQGRRRA